MAPLDGIPPLVPVAATAAATVLLLDDDSGGAMSVVVMYCVIVGGGVRVACDDVNALTLELFDVLVAVAVLLVESVVVEDVAVGTDSVRAGTAEEDAVPVFTPRDVNAATSERIEAGSSAASAVGSMVSVPAVTPSEVGASAIESVAAVLVESCRLNRVGAARVAASSVAVMASSRMV